MEYYLESLTNNILRKIAISSRTSIHDKRRIKQMVKYDLVEYIEENHILDIENVDNMRSIEITYFMDYYAIFPQYSRIYDNIASIKNSAKFKILEQIRRNYYLQDILYKYLSNDLNDLVSSYHINYCENSLNCESNVPNKLMEFDDCHQCCFCKKIRKSKNEYILDEKYADIYHSQKLNNIHIFHWQFKNCKYCVENKCSG